MADPTRKKPYLQVVREGNPSKKAIEPGVVIPPEDLVEPDWAETFVAADDERQQPVVDRLREIAAREWARVVPVLRRAAGLTGIDANVMHDYCVLVARIDQCERALSRDGLLMEGERGWQKHGATTIVNQYRAQLKIYIRELGLSPSARVSLKAPGDDDDGDDVFD